MISSILSLRGVANPPFFQVLGKRRDGSPGGVVQISVVQDEAFRPLHFCIRIMETSTGPGAGAGAGARPGVNLGVGAAANDVGSNTVGGGGIGVGSDGLVGNRVGVAGCPLGVVRISGHVGRS